MTRERTTYLLRGRRVAVIDLVDEGLLSEGDVLTFDRPRIGRTHTAVVGVNGALVLDGRSYGTPSAAACTAAGVTQIDGWTAWVTDQGSSLHSLRALLLDRVAGDAVEVAGNEAAEGVDHILGDEDRDSQDAEPPSSLLPRHEFLKQARHAAEDRRPLTISVRDLLARWGGRARGHRISRRIEADLDNHGLRSDPHFLRVALDDYVKLSIVEAEPQSVTLVESATGTETVTVLDIAGDAAERREIGMTLGNLVDPSRPLVSVTPTATLEEAVTKMLLNDFSQLPVVSKRNLVGAVTWQSIARARFKDPNAPFSEAIAEATEFPYDHDLNVVLSTLQSADFVVVRSAHNEITGIVTTADVVGLYGERTLPFLLIGELDQELRQVMERIDLELIQQVCTTPDSELASRDDMTMGHYQRVLENPDCWKQLNWPLDRVTFVHRLHELREIRNDIMHFNPDGVPASTVDMLRHMLEVIRKYGAPDEA